MTITALTPYLIVGDLLATLAHYRDALGFTIESAEPGPDGRLTHAEVSSGAARIMFGQAAPEWPVAPTMLYIEIDGDADALCARLRTAGAQINVEPDTLPYGRVFHVRDADGNELVFSGRAPATREPVAAAVSA